MAQKNITNDKASNKVQHLRNVFNSMNAMIGLLTPDGIFIEANRTALEAAKIVKHDVLSKPFEECYWWSWSSEEQKRLHLSIERAAAGQCIRYDAKIRLAENEYRDIDFMLSPMFGPDGRVAYLIPCATDITERKKAEKELLKKEERLGLALEAADQGTWEFILDNRCMNISQQLALIFGLESCDQLTSEENWRSFVVEQDQLLIQNAIEHSLKTDGRFRFEYRIMRANDAALRWILTEGRVLKNPDGTPERLIGIARDITEPKQTQAALKESEHKFRSLFENSPDAVMLTTPDGTIKAANPAACNMLGYTELELRTIGRAGIHDMNDPRIKKHWMSGIALGAFGVRN
jgi:PAS domain S-box-containing protein